MSLSKKEKATRTCTTCQYQHDFGCKVYSDSFWRNNSVYDTKWLTLKPVYTRGWRRLKGILIIGCSYWKKKLPGVKKK